MNAVAHLSSKGQIVIPKGTRERLGLRAGQPFEVVETPEGVLLKRVAATGTLSIEEAVCRLREIITYDGPAISIEEMNEAIREAGEEAARRSDCARG